VARNKVFDHFRRQKRHTAGLDESETAAPEPPLSARDILRWAEDELPDSESQSTLEWCCARATARSSSTSRANLQLPATRVRKRVSRLRKFLARSLAAERCCGTFGAAVRWRALLGRARRTPHDFVQA